MVAVLAFTVGVITFVAAFYTQGQGLVFPCLINVLLIADQVAEYAGWPAWLSFLMMRIVTALLAGLFATVLWFLLFGAVRNESIGIISAAALACTIVFSFPLAVLFTGYSQLSMAVLLMILAYRLIIEYDEEKQILALVCAGIALGLAGIINVMFIPAALFIAIGYPLFAIRDWGEFSAVQSILVFPLAFGVLGIHFLHQIYGWNRLSVGSDWQLTGFWDWPWLTVAFLLLAFFCFAIRSWAVKDRWLPVMIIVLSWMVVFLFVDKDQPENFLAVLALGIGSTALTLRAAGAGALLSVMLIFPVSCASWINAPAVQPVGQALQNLRNGHEARMLDDDWAVAQFIIAHGPVAVDSGQNVLAVRYYLLARHASKQLVEIKPEKGMALSSPLRLVSVAEGSWNEWTTLFRQGRWRVVCENRY